MARLRFAADRDAYLVAHAMVRVVLSTYEDRDPASWRFVANEHGRPEIDPAQRSRLSFNLSHTRGLVACAVATGRSVGVDVETTDRRIDADEISRRHFAAAEHRALAALPEDRRDRRFLEYWTLKEAYIKARGVGLGLPLDSFAIELGDGGPIGISFDDRAGDDPSGWQFDQRWVSATESLAVAIPRRGADLAVTLRDALPLLGSGQRGLGTFHERDQPPGAPLVGVNQRHEDRRDDHEAQAARPPHHADDPPRDASIDVHEPLERPH